MELKNSFDDENWKKIMIDFEINETSNFSNTNNNKEINDYYNLKIENSSDSNLNNNEFKNIKYNYSTDIKSIYDINNESDYNNNSMNEWIKSNFDKKYDDFSFSSKNNSNKLIGKNRLCLKILSKNLLEVFLTKKITNYKEITELTLKNLNENKCSIFSNNLNIKRRIYDSLNVLISLNFVIKKKKDLFLNFENLPSLKLYNQRLTAINEYNELAKEKIKNIKKLKYNFNSLKKISTKLKEICQRNIRQNNTKLVNLPFLLIEWDKQEKIEINNNNLNKIIINLNRKVIMHKYLDLIKTLKINGTIKP